MKSKKWVRSSEILHSEVGNEAILMSIQNSFYYGLDEIASRVGSMLEVPKSIPELCSILQDEFEVDEDACVRDVSDLLEELQKRDLIREVTPA